MEFKEIQDILKLVNRTDLTEVEIEKEGFKIKIRRKTPENNVVYTTQSPLPIPTTAPVVAPTPPAAKPVDTKTESGKAEESVKSENTFTFKSPMIGTFYRSGSPDSPPFVKVGDQIAKGQVLCIIEAMKLFNEIESEVEGKVVKILIDNAQPVEYDQPLFLIELA